MHNKKILNSDLPEGIFYMPMRRSVNDLGAVCSAYPTGEILPFYEDYDHDKLAGYINSIEYYALTDRCGNLTSKLSFVELTGAKYYRKNLIAKIINGLTGNSCESRRHDLMGMSSTVKFKQARQDLGFNLGDPMFMPELT